MRPTGPSSLVYLGIHGTVLALDRLTGVEVWRTPLKGQQFVNVVLDGDAVIASAWGEVFCLDALTGRIRWSNPLRGMGWGLVTVAGHGANGSSMVPMAPVFNDQAASSAASTMPASGG